MKKFIICPTCEQDKKKEVLAQIEDDGSISILRWHSSKTYLLGKEFSIKCGGCGEIVYNRVNEKMVS